MTQHPNVNTSHGSHPEQASNAPYAGQPQARTAPKRSVLATVGGVIFAIIGVLGLLGFLAQLANPAGNASAGGAQQAGRIAGILLLTVVPLLLSYLCFTAHRRKAKRQLP